MITEHQQEQAALYVLGLLGLGEQHRLAEQARADTELRELLWSLQRTMERLVLAIPATAPPPSLKAKGMQRLQAQTSAGPPPPIAIARQCCRRAALPAWRGHFRLEAIAHHWRLDQAPFLPT